LDSEIHVAKDVAVKDFQQRRVFSREGDSAEKDL